MSLLDDLKWRYAAKSMNGAEVPQEKLDYILEAARLAPSSSGLQPYKVFVITNKELLEKIKNVAWNQAQCLIIRWISAAYLTKLWMITSKIL